MAKTPLVRSRVQSWPHVAAVLVCLLLAGCSDSNDDTSSQSESSAGQDAAAEFLDGLVEDRSGAGQSDLEAAAYDLMYGREGKGLEEPTITTPEIQEAVAAELNALRIGDFGSPVKAATRAIYDPEARTLMVLGGGGEYWFAYDRSVEPITEVDGVLEERFELDASTGEYVPTEPDDTGVDLQYAVTSCATGDLMRVGPGVWAAFESGVGTIELRQNPFVTDAVTIEYGGASCVQ